MPLVSNQVSIVVCANCGHSHDDGYCTFMEFGQHTLADLVMSVGKVAEEMGEQWRLQHPELMDSYQAAGEIVECGCDAWHPILKPFAEAGKPKPIPNGDEHWGWKVLAWALLAGLFAWALTSKGGI